MFICNERLFTFDRDIDDKPAGSRALSSSQTNTGFGSGLAMGGSGTSGIVPVHQKQ